MEAAIKTEPKLGWGLRHAVPEDARAAWGARAIVEERGFSLLPDRQEIWAADQEAKDALASALNGPNRGDGAISKAQETAGKLMDAGEIRNQSGGRDEPGEHLLYENDEIKIVGNTNGSYGYLYLAGWLK